jgi:tetratricopeptide (TPR) repeat protein
MHRRWHIALIAIFAAAAIGCSTKKNTVGSRRWHAFNARYNTYFNGSQAFIEGNLEKEKGHQDNFTEMLPLYPVAKRESREIGKSLYDRAIEKSEKAIRQHSIKVKPEWNKDRRKTAKDREWLGRREYNPFLWRAWLLLGKAQFQEGAFEEAAATFTYMTRLYHTQPLQYGLARAWLAKCYTELGWLYDAEDVIRNMSRDSMDFRAVKDWDYTYANYYIAQRDYEKAVPYLRKVISHERRRVQRAREWYLMGQIETLLGHREKAYEAYQHVIRNHPPYELEFNARISQTEVMPEGSKQKLSKLRRMARNDNNKEYLDQVYYAIGNVYLTERDTMQAIAAYEKGNQKSVRHGIEKGVLLLTLGNLYWDMERYNDAQRCYGEAIGLLDKERPDYETLALRSKVLDELVPYTDAIHLQDSLLLLSEMPEADRLKAINRVIDALKKKEKEERDALLAEEAEQRQIEQFEQADFGQRQPQPLPPTPQGMQQGNGQWYFYNPVAVSQGKMTFQRQWGKRENKDNWQRSNQTVIDLGEPVKLIEPADLTEPADSLENPGAPDRLENLENPDLTDQPDSLAQQAQLDPHEPAYYLAQIPFTAEQKAAAHEILKDALFHAGIIFKDKLDNLGLSEKYLVRLTQDYPDFPQLDEAWYHLFLLYSRQGKTLQATNCLSRLQTDFPESEWTILLSDPYFKENARFGEHIEDSLYAATYEAFKTDRADIVKHNVKLSEERFPLGANRAKFLFIDGMTRLNEGDGDGCLERLKQVVEQYPESEVSELAGMIIKGVQEGRRLYGGKFDIGEVWSRRDITMLTDSTRADTLSAARDERFVFILAYEPDSVNENQLLFEMARYNFTNFLVRSFEITIDEDEGMHRMHINGFLSYDEAMQYARQLYADQQMAEKLKDCRSLIISETNLALIGTRFSYDDYQQFYEDTFVPMKISEQKLLIEPAEIELPDVEDLPSEQQTEQQEDDDDLFPNEKPQQKVQDFEFGDDFW